MACGYLAITEGESMGKIFVNIIRKSMKISFKIHFMGKLLILMICLSLLSSCASISSNKGSSVIDIASSVNKGAIYKASDFIKSIRYVPLEMTEASALGYVTNVVVEQEKIYVNDGRPVIHIFDINGAYLQTFGRQGRGPGEYLHISGFTVNEAGHLFILSQSQGVFEYDTNLSYVRRISPTMEPSPSFSDVITPKEGLFASNIFYVNWELGEIKEDWVMYDSTAVQHTYNASIQSFDPSTGSFRAYQFAQYVYKNILNIYRIGNDTIFRVDYEKQFERMPRYILNYGKYCLTEEFYHKNDDIPNTAELISLREVFETDQYLFMGFNFRGLAPEVFTPERKRRVQPGGFTMITGGRPNTQVYAVYHKHTGLISVLNHPAPQTLGLKDDIANGIAFWPMRISAAQELIAWHDAADLLLLVEEGKMDKDLVKNLKEDDNPVVLIAVPK